MEYAPRAPYDSRNNDDERFTPRCGISFDGVWLIGSDRRTKGTGPGLSTVHGLIAQSGGTIHAASAIGEGSAFTILLPKAPADFVYPAAPKVVEPDPAVGIVLMVEDESPFGWRDRPPGSGVALKRLAQPPRLGGDDLDATARSGEEPVMIRDADLAP